MTTQTSTTGAELAHPGTWLPGDQITQPAGTIWERGVSDWGVPASTSSPRVTDDGMDAYLAASANARIVHLVPREGGQESTLPDVSDWVKVPSAEFVEEGTPFVVYAPHGRAWYKIRADDETIILIPQPAPGPETAWKQISTDWENPTDAYVNGVPGRWFRDGEWIYFIDPDGDDRGATKLHSVTSVTPLAVCPADHVPVPWKLLHRAVWWVANGFIDDAIEASDTEAREIVRDLAALVEKGAES